MVYVCSIATCFTVWMNCVCFVFCLHAENQEVVTTWHNIMAANPAVVKFLSSFVNKGYVTICVVRESQISENSILLFAYG